MVLAVKLLRVINQQRLFWAMRGNCHMFLFRKHFYSAKNPTFLVNGKVHVYVKI